VSVVIVMDDNNVAVAIIAADVAPVERASADEQCEERADRASKETLTDDAKRHPLGTVTSDWFRCQRTERLYIVGMLINAQWVLLSRRAAIPPFDLTPRIRTRSLAIRFPLRRTG